MLFRKLNLFSTWIYTDNNGALFFLGKLEILHFCKKKRIQKKQKGVNDKVFVCH